MGSIPVLTQSRSIIMHASLAHLSPELQTFDSVIRISSRLMSSTTPMVRLPPEVLLLIREQLVPTITIQLFQHSVAALKQYESCLRRLLCQDCASYYEYVYGPDIWQWEQFSGPCFCTRKSDPVDLEAPVYWGIPTSKRPFNTCSAWLEQYLSFEASRLSSQGESFSSIWDLVRAVLREYDCEIAGHIITGTTPANRTTNTLSIASVLINSNSTGFTHLGDRRALPIPLHRVNRDLALSYEYPDSLELRREDTPIAACQTPWKPPHPLPNLTHTVTSFAFACCKLPVTLATMLLTIFCYYSKPHILGSL